MQLEDGAGSGKKVRVTDEKRLTTSTITNTDADYAALLGDRYNINTGTIGLTSDSESAVLYLKNTGTADLYVVSLIFIFGDSTGGAGGDLPISIERNPTGGTIVVDQTAADIAGVNYNFGRSKTISANIYKGAEGKTLTGGTDIIQSILNDGGRTVIALGALILPTGTSLGCLVTPPSGNTSMNMQCAAAVFEKNFES